MKVSPAGVTRGGLDSLAVGIVAAVVAVHARRRCWMALGAAVCGFVMQSDIPTLPSPANAASFAHAITDLVIGGLDATVRWGSGSGAEPVARELLDGLTVAAGAGSRRGSRSPTRRSTAACIRDSQCSPRPTCR